MALTMHRHIVRERETQGGERRQGEERKEGYTENRTSEERGEERESKSLTDRERRRKAERERGRSERERDGSRKPLLIFISSARSSQLLVVAVRRCVVIGYVSF